MPAGRPRKELDAEQIQYLASIGCTQAEIGGFFGVAQSTISLNYRSEFALGEAESRITLRKRQWNASKKSVPMLIHLGKQMLGQSDKVERTNVEGQPRVIMLPEKELHADPDQAADRAADEAAGNDG